MTTRDALLEKIESLPPEKRAEVERLVDSLARSPEAEHKPAPFPPGLLERINAVREQLLREHGPFDTLPLIREFRETGGR